MNTLPALKKNLIQYSIKLSMLKQLHKQGLITDAEYQQIWADMKSNIKPSAVG
jgi:hypothetical protein